MRDHKTSTLLICFLVFSIQGCYTGFHVPTKHQALYGTAYNWQHDSTAHFDYYYEQSSPSAYYADSVKIYFEQMYPELLNFLEVNNYPNRLNLFMVGSRIKMKELIGIETNGYGYAEDNTVYSVFNKEIKTFGKHEFCHVICYNCWEGWYKEIWISEGLAVASDNSWWGFELHSLSNYLHARNKLIQIRKLIDNFHNYNSLISYPEIGSFVKYIKEKYGTEIVKEIWKGGVKTLENKLNKRIEAIEDEWLSEIKKHDYKDVDYKEKVLAKFDIAI